MIKKRQNAKLSKVLITFCLILLFNPLVKMVDIFPDFIAYFVFALMLNRITYFVPHACELRSSLLKLGVFSLLRLPLQLIITQVGATNATEKENLAVTLTFAFCIIEAVLFIIATNNFYQLIAYMGQRSDSISLIKPIFITNHRAITIDELRVFTVIFAVVKFSLCAIPETFLLYFDPFAATITPFKIRAAYPYAIIASVVIVTVFGIIWLTRTSRFAKAIIKDGSFSSAVEYFKTLDTAKEIESNRRLAHIRSYLYLLIAASCLTLDLSFTDLDEINILPHFVFTLAATFALFKLFPTKGKRIVISVFSVFSTAASVVFWIYQTKFLSKYSYSDILYSKTAKALYKNVIILSAAETLFIILFIVCTVLLLRGFILKNTAVEPTDPRYSRADKNLHQSLFKKGAIYATLGALLNIAKLVQVLLQIDVNYFLTSTETGTSVIYTTPIPWFGVVVTILTFLFAGFAFNYFGSIKDEVELKYEYEVN